MIFTCHCCNRHVIFLRDGSWRKELNGYGMGVFHSEVLVCTILAFSSFLDLYSYCLKSVLSPFGIHYAEHCEKGKRMETIMCLKDITRLTGCGIRHLKFKSSPGTQPIRPILSRWIWTNGSASLKLPQSVPPRWRPSNSVKGDSRYLSFKFVVKDRHGGLGRDSWYLYVNVYP